MFKRIVPGILRLLVFWIVSNANIIVSTKIPADIYPDLERLRQALRIWWPIIFWLIWLFIESEIFKNNSLLKIDEWMKLKLPKRLYNSILFFIKLILLLLVILLILTMFYVYDQFIKTWSML